MESLRKAIANAGYSLPANDRRSVRAWARSQGLKPPISVKRLSDHLDPEQVTWRTGKIIAGDVEATGQLTVMSSGWWVFDGELFDDGDFFGDTYVFSTRLVYTDDSGKTRGFKQQGELEAGEKKKFYHNGKDSWIEENWEAIRAKGYKYALKAEPEVEFGDLVELSLVALGVGVAGVAVVLWGAAEIDDDNCYWTTDGSGSAERVCHIEVE